MVLNPDIYVDAIKTSKIAFFSLRKPHTLFTELTLQNFPNPLQMVVMNMERKRELNLPGVCQKLIRTEAVIV